MSIDIQRRTYASISAFSLVTIFSAFDDFLIGTKAELHRFHAAKKKSTLRHKTDLKQLLEQHVDHGAVVDPDDDNDDSEERLRIFYKKNDWDSSTIEPFLKTIRYFRLCRNCIAHRNGRASRALVEQASDDKLHEQVKPLLDRASSGLKKYVVNQNVLVEPTQAILCSHLLRMIAQDANKRLLGTLGMDGFLQSVAHHTMFGDVVVRSDVCKTPEAVLNFALTDRYRATVANSRECIQEMKRLGLWKKYMDKWEEKSTLA